MPYSRSKFKKSRPPVMWPDLRYGPNGECKLFNAPEEVPLGWKARVELDPGYVAPESLKPNRPTVIQRLIDKGIEPNPTWSVAYMMRMLDDCSTDR